MVNALSSITQHPETFLISALKAFQKRFVHVRNIAGIRAEAVETSNLVLLLFQTAQVNAFFQYHSNCDIWC